MATALEAGGLRLGTPLWSARAVLEAPGAVVAAHRAFLEAGADCISSAGYQASLEGLREAGLDGVRAEDALRRTVALAVEARDAFWATGAHGEGRVEPIVAASAGPYGAFLADGSEYDGRYGVGRDALERFHRGRLDVLADTDADIIAFETVPSAVEAEVLGQLVAERPETPAWISFSCRDGVGLWDGTPIAAAVKACGSPNSLVAVGLNCTDPRYVRTLIDKIVPITDLPIIVYPNSGEGYDRESRSWTGRPAPWLDEVGDWVGAGARVIGGCCRVGPDDISRLRTHMEEHHAL